MFLDAGALLEIINGERRLFVKKYDDVFLKNLIEEFPVVSITSGRSADDIMNQTTDEINGSINASNPNNLHFIHPFFRLNPDDNPYVNVQNSNYKFIEDETEKRYQSAKKPKKQKLLERIKEFAKQSVKGFLSDLPELRGDDKLIYAQELLRKLKRERKADVQETILRLRAAIKNLNPDDFDLFERAMILMDLKETFKNDPDAALPYGYNPATLEYDLNNIMHEVNNNPVVQDAIDKAEILGRDISEQLIDAADDLQMFDIRNKLQRKHYFRHIVLEYYSQAKGGVHRATMKNPLRRGYLKHREGSEKDISSDWIMAMGEVWTRMNGDIKILRTLKQLRDSYDIIEELKQKAFKQNIENALNEIMNTLRGVPEEFRRQYATEFLERQLTHKQAQSISRLFKLAKAGDLPEGNNHEWAELIHSLVNAGTLERLNNNERQQLTRYIGWLSGLERKSRARSTAQRFLRGDFDKNAKLKKLLGENFVKWQDLIPDDYELWAPSDSRLVFSANTVPENVLLIAQENLDELLGVPLSELGNAINSGGNKQLWCIPSKLAETLNKLGKKQPQGLLAQAARKSMNAFKKWILLTPAGGRVFKYNWRNFFGDIEAVLQGNPGALFYFNQACKELSNFMLKGGVPTGLLAEFQKRGGGLTNEFINEIENWQDLEDFAHLFEKQKEINPLKCLCNS